MDGGAVTSLETLLRARTGGDNVLGRLQAEQVKQGQGGREGEERGGGGERRRKRRSEEKL